MNHEKYTITTTFTVCEGTRDKALEEVKELLNHIKLKSLDHVSDLKIVITHESLEKSNE